MVFRFSKGSLNGKTNTLSDRLYNDGNMSVMVGWWPLRGSSLRFPIGGQTGPGTQSGGMHLLGIYAQALLKYDELAR